MTAKPIRPRAVAKGDIQDAVDHYLSEAGKRPALAFIDELQRAYRQIARYPESGSPRYAHELDLPGLRSWPLKRYPFLVFYVATEDYIEIWRVLHSERDIPAWISEQS